MGQFYTGQLFNVENNVTTKVKKMILLFVIQTFNSIDALFGTLIPNETEAKPNRMFIKPITTSNRAEIHVNCPKSDKIKSCKEVEVSFDALYDKVFLAIQYTIRLPGPGNESILHFEQDEKLNFPGGLVLSRDKNFPSADNNTMTTQFLVPKHTI